MRPRKVILLVDADERHAGEVKYLLFITGYRVMVAHDAAAALALHDLGVDLVLGFADGMLPDWAALAERMKARIPETPVIVVTRLKHPSARFALAPQANFVYEQASTAELLQWIKLQIARKRGPRRHLPELVPALAGD